MTGGSAQDASTRFGYELEALRVRQRRFTTVCFVIMGVAAVGLAVGLATVSEGDWWGQFALPFLVAIGAALLLFIVGMVLAQVLRQLVPESWALFTDTAALGVTALLGLFAVSFFLDSWAALLSALLGVVVGTAAPMSVATSPLTAVLQDRPHAEAMVAQLRPTPTWSNLLESDGRGMLVGIASDLVFRLASLVLLWYGVVWLLPLIVVVLAEAAVSSRAVANGNRVLWLAPGILAAVGAVTAAALLLVAGAPA